MVVLLVSMQGQKAHGFHVCSEDKQRSCGFRRTQGGVINDRFVFILGLTIPSNSSTPKSCNPAFAALSLSSGSQSCWNTTCSHKVESMHCPKCPVMLKH